MRDKLLAIIILTSIFIASIVVVTIPFLLSFGFGYFIGWLINLMLPQAVTWLPVCLGASFTVLKYLFWKTSANRE